VTKVEDTASAAPRHHDREHPGPRGGAAPGRYPPDASSCASEVLAIVAYITAVDGALHSVPGPGTELSRWHERLVGKAAERLGVIDASMRSRVAFLVAGRDRGYHAPQVELELAGATLDACRTATAVVEDLLGGRLPTTREFDAMGHTALAVYPALVAARELDAPRANADA
jgi:hypothetical protein